MVAAPTQGLSTVFHMYCSDCCLFYLLHLLCIIFYLSGKPNFSRLLIYLTHRETLHRNDHYIGRPNSEIVKQWWVTTRDQKVCQLNYFAYLKTLFLTHWKYCFLRPYISSKTAPITEVVGNYDTVLNHWTESSKSLAKAKQAVVSRDHLSMSVVSKKFHSRF